MVQPCGICGSVGIEEALVACSQCTNTSHLYCMRDFPKPIADLWICEECESNNAARESASKPSEVVGKLQSVIPEKSDSRMPARSSEKQRQLQKGNVSRTQGSIPPLGKIKDRRGVFRPQLMGQPKMNKGMEPLITKTNLSETPRHRILPEEEPTRAKDSQGKKRIYEISSIGDKNNPPGTSYGKNEVSSSTVDTTAGFTPALETLWKGTFSVRVEYGRWRLDNELQAHPSSRVLQIIYQLPWKMPEMLHFDAVPLNQYLSEFFKDCTPDQRDIGLYFFPTHWRSDEWYVSLVESISSNMYALRKEFGNVELIVFTSKLLHTKCQRWKGKYYLWGVFSPLNQDAPKVRIPPPVAGAAAQGRGKEIKR